MVEAGRRNRAKWRGFTPEGLERLRAAALASRPWEHATGPRTAEGKRRSAANGKARQKGETSVRELRAELAGFHALLQQMAAARTQIAESRPRTPDR